ncbi:MAG: metal-dependent hydrolase [Burkholderiales bacterium]
MDTLTHALSGALLARATAPTPAADVIPLRRRIAIGTLAAAFPDIDVVASWLSPLSYLYHHRGVTHSLVMLGLWAVLLAWLCTRVWPSDKNKGSGWRAYAGIIAWGIAAHIAGDWITSFGTMVFAPVSDWRAALSTTFIIDLWFSGIIIAGLLASWVWRKSFYARWPAVAGLMVLCTYVLFQFAMQQRAIDFGERFVMQSGLRNAKVSALPRPVSPFNWMVVIETDDRYHYSLISLSRLDAPPLAPDAGFFERMGAAYLPLDRAVWLQAGRHGSPEQMSTAKEVLAHPQFAFFRWFAQYPVLYRVDAGNPHTCVWFQDLRFFTPGRAAWPFRYGMCREMKGEWRAYELLSDNTASRVY